VPGAVAEPRLTAGFDRIGSAAVTRIGVRGHGATHAVETAALPRSQARLAVPASALAAHALDAMPGLALGVRSARVMALTCGIHAGADGLPIDVSRRKLCVSRRKLCAAPPRRTARANSDTSDIALQTWLKVDTFQRKKMQ